MTKQVVIIGAGFGGLACARALARAPVSLTLLDRENHHLFQPLLYQVATAGLSPGDIAVPVRSVLRRQKNANTIMAEVETVDFEQRQVLLSDGSTVSYDYLVIAAGAKSNYFGHDGWEDHAYGLKTLRDAVRIRERLLLALEAAERTDDPARRRELLTFVVIGAGPTGVEMAGAISELSRRTVRREYKRVKPSDIRVVLVEMADRVLTPFHPELSESAKRQLHELKVETRLGERVTDVRAGGVEINGSWMDASIVVWASGVQPVSLAERLDTKRSAGGLHVQQDCSLPDHPEVFAIGDVAHFVPAGQREELPGVSPVAMQQGRHVAKLIRRELKGKHRLPFSYLDKGIMATIGRSRAVAQSGPMRLSGLAAWIAWLMVHIYFLIGFRNRLMVLMNWCWQYFAFRQGVRIIAMSKGRAALQLSTLLADDSSGAQGSKGQQRPLEATTATSTVSAAGS